MERTFQFGVNQKRVLLGVAIGSALGGSLLYYYYNKSKRPNPNIYAELKRSLSVKENYSRQNGDILHESESPDEGEETPRARTPCSSKHARSSSLDSADTAATLTQDASQTPDQLCQLGLDSFSDAIRFWEDALVKIHTEDHQINDPGAAKLEYELEDLLRKARMIQVEYERKLAKDIDRASIDLALLAIQQMDKEYEQERRSAMPGVDSSETESFVSATALADLSDLEKHSTMFDHLVLYKAALIELKHNTIPCRTLRTKLTGCLSDTEFLAKVHCLRLGFSELLKDKSTRDWIESQSKAILASLMVRAEKDPTDFCLAFNQMSEYSQATSNHEQIWDELKDRGVKKINFFDVVLDFILMDAFDDLNDPPRSLMTIMQNRWLSDGFKEKALATAVWSVLKAKRSVLKYKDGFISRFYAISEQISPVLACGFLLENGRIRDLCQFFKAQVTAMIVEMFDFGKVRFNRLEELVDDLIKVLKKYATIFHNRLDGTGANELENEQLNDQPDVPEVENEQDNDESVVPEVENEQDNDESEDSEVQNEQENDESDDSEAQNDQIKSESNGLSGENDQTTNEQSDDSKGQNEQMKDQSGGFKDQNGFNSDEFYDSEEQPDQEIDRSDDSDQSDVQLINNQFNHSDKSELKRKIDASDESEQFETKIKTNKSDNSSKFETTLKSNKSDNFDK